MGGGSPKGGGGLRHLRFALFVLAVSAVGVEAGVRVLALDMRLVSRNLAYLQQDLPVLRQSEDRLLHYELRPGSALVMGPQPGGPPQASYAVHVDRYGARGVEHPEPKRAGVFRILALGGSTTYGYEVNDDETIPAALERTLNARGASPTFEVWNYGLLAYQLSQAAHRASLEVGRRRADLVLVQTYNRGRRFFRWNERQHLCGLRPYFEEDWTIRENLFAPFDTSAELHLALARHLAVYRTAAALLAPTEVNGRDAEANRLSESKARELVDVARAAGAEVVFYSLPAGEYPQASPDDISARAPVPPDPDTVYRGLDRRRFISFARPGREVDYYRVHPPPRILAEWARTLADELDRRGFLPATPER